MAYYISSGITSSGITLSNNSMYIRNGGTADSTTVNADGSMFISSGGVANSTTVNSSGYMSISSGGTANRTTVNFDGIMEINNGGIANSTTVNSGCHMGIYSGGTANHTIINFDGIMGIGNGGIANSTTVNSGGYMEIYSCATATAIKENGGYVYIAEGADVTFASNTISGLALSNASMTVHQNTIANSTTVNSSGRMNIYNGGVANSTTINSGGNMYISSGGTANSTTVNSRGSMFISSGGVANSTTVNYLGWMYIYSGMASDTTMSGGNMYIYSGVANNTTLNSRGYMYIYSGGVANSTTVNYLGGMYIRPSGVANSTIVNSDGYMYISSGGTATNIIASSGGRLTINVASNTYITGTYNNSAFEMKDAKISGYTIMSGGSMRISSGGVANSTTINDGGNMYIFSGGVANSTTINSGGVMRISSGGVANSTTINDGGNMYISNGGVANNTTINSGGDMYISGVANSTTVNSSGYMRIYSDGVHRGSLQIESGAVVSAYEGSKIDFTVAGRTESDGYLINDLSLVKGAPTYTITVSATQASGTYKLAQGAASFNSTISIGDGSTTYGSITVNGDDLVRNGVTYSLDQANGNLTLTISKPAPGVSNLTGNANGVSWNGNGSAFVVEYSKDNFANVLQLETSTTAVDTYQIGAGSWKVRAKDEAETTFNAQTGFTAAAPTGSATQIVSDADGNLDVFFVRTAGTWDAKHLAKHLGDFNGWQGTKERVALTGKNIITDVFTGSTDANILVLTDDANGDALFLDDAFTALGNQARLGNIDEIRAGAGNDVIDLTSPKFAYVGDNMTVFGGSGDDVIWANSGTNTLYGDAGNDRIIGGSGNDFIIGGAGNDVLHGGGGSDTFCFGANWGADTVEQLASGKVILRFETGSMSNWNAATGVYSDGTNTVTVTGTSDIELYFGTASTLPQDAFAPTASEKIFEQLA